MPHPTSSEFTVQCERNENLDANVVSPSGNIDIFNYQILNKYLQDLLVAGGFKRVLVDLAATAYIASSGWAVLLCQARMLKKQGGNMILANMRDEIKDVYEAMNLESLLPCAVDASQVKALLDRNGK